jgi:hypothetical protein
MLEPLSRLEKNMSAALIKKEWERLDQEKAQIERCYDSLSEEIIALTISDWKKIDQKAEREENKYLRAKRALHKGGIEFMIGWLKRFIEWLKPARGCRGVHPKPFNVFIYHLINRCTTWKRDKNRVDIFRRDGQHRLERDWDLILFLLLDIHVHQAKLPGLDKFIAKNARRPAAEALRILKKRLWDIYKNFPAKDGWPFERQITEIGFRKLIVDNNGKLRIIRL